MTDIATLALSLDSRPVAQATAELNKLAPAARNAEQNVSGLQKAAAFAATSNEAVAKSTRNASGSLANLSFQINDIASGLAMGQSPFQIMAQQGGQVFQVWQQNNNVFKDAARWIGSVLTPMRGLAIAAVAAGAAGYALNSAWNKTMRQFDDTARAIGATINEVRALQTLAGAKGIDDFSEAAEKFGAAIYQARSGAGGLAEVFRANNTQVGTFSQTLARAAELIRRAGDDQQRLALLQKMGLPATMDWVRLLEQGGDRILQLVAQADKSGNALQKDLIDRARDFDEKWDYAWKRFKNGAMDAVTSAKGFVSSLIESVDRFAMSKDPSWGLRTGSEMLKNGYGTPLGGANDSRFAGLYGREAKEDTTKDYDRMMRGLNIEQQRISILGQSASVQQQVRAVEIQVQQARLAGVTITDTELQKLKELAGERALGITGIKAQADAYKIETDTIGMGIGQAAAYAAAQNAINDARRDGRVLTAENIAAIEMEASALGRAAQRADDLRFGFDTFRGTFVEFGQAIRNGATAWDALAKAGVSALGKIADKLMETAAIQLWTGLFGGPAAQFGAGFGNVLGSLFAGGFHSGGMANEPTFHRLVPASAFDNAPRFHSGIGPGEKAAIIRNDESVLTPGQMRALAPAGSGGGDINVTINQTNTFTNADPGSEARLRQWADQTKHQAISESVAAVSKARSTTPSFDRSRR